MTSTVRPVEIASLADQLTNTQDRETYSALMCYLNRLPPGDEFRQLAELLGLLSLVGQRIPEAINGFLAELRAQESIAARHRCQLEARLADLPREVAHGVDPSSLAKAMSESFRQQLANTGLQDTAFLLKAAVITLKSLSTEVSTVLQPAALTLTNETEKLILASREVGELNERLIEDKKTSRGVWQVVLLISAFSLGTLYGGFLERRSIVDGISAINVRLQELHESARFAPVNSRKP